MPFPDPACQSQTMCPHDIVEQAVCPKKKKPAAQPSERDAEMGDELNEVPRSAAEDDDNLEELERQNRPLLERGAR